MSQMSGWMRLWVVLAGLYFIVVAIFIIVVIPKKSEIERSWAFDVVEAAKKYDKSLSNRSALSIMESYDDLSYKEIIKRVRNKFQVVKDEKGKTNWAKAVTKHKIKELEKQYKDRIANINTDRAKMAGIGFLVWFVPVTVVYILGLVVRWIVRGFKADYTKKE